jgi:putative ABC transport system permease protein
MVITMVMLAAGGASFIAALGSAASWNRTIDDAFANIKYDIDVRFAQPYAVGAIEKSIRTVPGVTGVETWGFLMSTAFPKYSDGTYGGPYAVLAPRAETTLINPPLFEGRWLRPDDTNAMVVDTDFTENARKRGTPVVVGDELTFSLDGQNTAWQVVGIVGKSGFQSVAYANYDYFAEITGRQGLAASARVVVGAHDETLRETASRTLEQRLAEDGFNVFIVQDLTAARQVMENHVILILAFLMLMSILVAAIGALGLASTMSVNVMDRVREIGIMRSVGASTKAILWIVIMEGVIIGVLSWLLGAAVSIPVTTVIARTAGSIFLSVPMSIVIPPWVAFLWLLIVIAVAIVASYSAARGATRLTVREVLAYE